MLKTNFAAFFILFCMNQSTKFFFSWFKTFFYRSFFPNFYYFLSFITVKSFCFLQRSKMKKREMFLENFSIIKHKLLSQIPTLTTTFLFLNKDEHDSWFKKKYIFHFLLFCWEKNIKLMQKREKNNEKFVDSSLFLCQCKWI